MDGHTNRQPRLTMLLTALVVTISSFGQTPRKPAAGSAAISQTVSFGLADLIRTGTPATVILPFSVTIPKTMAAGGYGLSASASFRFVPAAPDRGGRSITASDIGIGIAGIASAAGLVNAPHIAAGFEQDPSANRGNSRGGLANGQPTLADLLSAREILRMDKSSQASIPDGGTDLQITLKVALPSKYFTPGSFSANLTVTAVK
jgi:hypothetical protein